MFNFVRLHDRHHIIDHPWILECSNFNTLVEHNKKYMSSEIEKGIHNLFGINNNTQHIRINWAAYVTQNMMTTGKIKSP